MLGKIVTGSANQNQEAKKAQEAKPASDLDGSTPSNQPPLVNILLLNQYNVRPQSPIGPQSPHRAPVAKISATGVWRGHMGSIYSSLA